MPKFDIDIPHALPAETVRARLQGATPKIEKSYGATCTWKNDRQLEVSRKGFDALLTIEPSRVHVGMSLGFLLTPLANTIKTGLTKELSSLLTDTAGPGGPGGDTGIDDDGRGGIGGGGGGGVTA